jgi:hypothetical protein
MATQTTMKPKSASHVVQLKERTKERIRKAQGPSSTPKTELPQHPDVPPFVEKLKKTSEEMIASGKWKGINSGACLDDATAGLPPEAMPEPLKAGVDKLRKHAQDLVDEGVVPQQTADAAVKLVLNSFTQLPVEHHGHQNDLAKSVISKVPTPKLDPNSEEAELARLQKHQMPVKKKGGE